MRHREQWEPTRPAQLRPLTDLSVTPLLGILIVVVLGYVVALGPIRALDVRTLPSEAATTYYESRCDSQVVLSYHADGELDINMQAVTREGLEMRLRTIYEQRSCRVIYIAAHETVRYRHVADLVDAAKAAGLRQVVMITPGARADYDRPSR